ncbi:MAG: phosphoribosylanthranilate isomerase [Myxococcales bacterium]|nr:phosphoribosylanthranilate isomerase [Myxococcales bacterium]
MVESDHLDLPPCHNDETLAPTRVKICCMTSHAEAALAVQMGADAVGLVGPMPSGPGPIPDDRAAAIARSLPPPVASFLLTSQTTAESIAAHVARVQPSAVQIVNHIDPTESAALAARLGPVRIVQVIHVEDAGALDRIDAYGPHVHAFLLDSGRPTAAVSELGGTGRVHDWSISRAFVERSPLPVFLAGGLNPENAAEAITSVRPWGLDVCSGVRTDARLDPVKLAAFMSAVRNVPPER